jgi:hypothetical protein
MSPEVRALCEPGRLIELAAEIDGQSEGHLGWRTMATVLRACAERIRAAEDLVNVLNEEMKRR